MKKTCTVSGVEFEITGDDMKFYERMGVSIPTLCPEERMRRRLAFVNIQNLYRRENLISPFSVDKKFNIIAHEIWWSDEIDGKDFGRDFDFKSGQSFFEQFEDLQKVAPRWDRISFNSENCSWSLNIANSKNCYLCRSAEKCEDCFYCNELYDSSDVSDCENSKKLELCYDVFEGENCFETFFSYRIRNVNNSALLFDCENCNDCLCCIGLRHKKNYFLNEKYSEKDFNEIWEKFFKNFSFREECMEKFKIAKQKFPRRNLLILNSENVSGDKVFNSKNVKNCFDVHNFEDVKYGDSGSKTKDSMDISRSELQELTYETISNYKLYNSKFCFNSIDLIDCDYCETSAFLKNCFGCVGLKHAKYCILNKQYSKEEYFKLRDRIIEHMKKTGEWGEFFPVEMSPFGYNETVAQEYFPLSRPLDKNHPNTLYQEGLKENKNIPSSLLDKGNLEDLNLKYKWKDSENKTKYDGPKVEIPDCIFDVLDSICNQILECEECAKNYRIVKPELKFYRKMNLPIPHKCPDCRHIERMKLRNPRKLWDRTCDKCNCKIKTSFAPNRPEKVYCERCYLGSLDL